MGFSKNIRASGGFLNNVDGTFVSYEFTRVPPKQRKESEWVYLVPSIRVDGSEEEVTQHLFMGGAERYEISKDGLSLTMVDETPVTIGAKTPAGRFLGSLIEKGFPESSLPDLEAGEALNLEAVNGTRLRFVQEKDPEGTEKAGKRKDKKTGKEYDRTNTLVAAVLALPGEEKRGKGSTRPTLTARRAAGATATTSRSSKAAGKPNGKMQEADLTEEADTVLLEILGDKDGEIKRKSLSIEITKRRMKDPNRDAIRELVYSEAYLTDAVERGVIEFDQKTQTVTAA